MRPVLNAAALLPVFLGSFFKERTNNNGVLQTPRYAVFADPKIDFIRNKKTL